MGKTFALLRWRGSRLALRKPLLTLALWAGLGNFCLGIQTAAAAPPAFNDARFAELLRTQPRGIIYMWSPAMPLSVVGAVQIERLLAKSGWHLTLLLDPEFSDFFAADDPLMLQSELQECSKLAAAGLDNHYPSIMAYSHGRLHRQVLAGYETPDGLKVYLKEIFGVGGLE